MPQATLSFSDQEQIRALFGIQDQHLRLVRDRLGIQVVVRGDELRIAGDEDQVAQGREVLSEMQGILERFGELVPADVERILNLHTGALPPAKNPDPLSADHAGDDLSAPSASAVSIDLFEKAKAVRPKTEGQEVYVEAIRDNDLVFSTGPAGCGKTYLAVAMGLNALRTERVKKIVLVRPAVEAGERLGYLPGDMLAKVNPYLRPLLDALADILSFDQVKRYMEHDIIEIIPLAFMRGRTLNDTFIILDEAQNTSATQMKMFLTRMGENSKIVVTGDPTQVDLPPNVKSGLSDAVRRLRDIPGVEAIELTGQDIVRHRLVREIVRAYDDEHGRNGSRSRRK